MHAVAIDVGGTTLKTGLVAPDGTLTHRRQLPTPRDTTALVETVATAARSLTDEAHAEGLSTVPTVGVVVPGIIDEASGFAVLSVNLGWRDVPLRDLLVAATGAPVAFGHDVRAGALAEGRWGAGSDEYLYVAVGTGIAAGLVLGGRPHPGGGYAGELGLTLVRDPATGTTVPVESIVSAAALARRYNQRRPDFDPAEGSRGVFDAATHDQVARDVIDEAVEATAELLAASLCLVGPLRVVVGGGLAEAGGAFLDPLRTRLAELLPLRPAPEVVRATLGPWGQCIGAGALALDAERLASLP